MQSNTEFAHTHTQQQHIKLANYFYSPENQKQNKINESKRKVVCRAVYYKSLIKKHK